MPRRRRERKDVKDQLKRRNSKAKEEWRQLHDIYNKLNVGGVRTG